MTETRRTRTGRRTGQRTAEGWKRPAGWVDLLRRDHDGHARHVPGDRGIGRHLQRQVLRGATQRPGRLRRLHRLGLGAPAARDPGGPGRCRRDGRADVGARDRDPAGGRQRDREHLVPGRQPGLVHDPHHGRHPGDLRAHRARQGDQGRVRRSPRLRTRADVRRRPIVAGARRHVLRIARLRKGRGNWWSGGGRRCWRRRRRRTGWDRRHHDESG